MYWFVVCTPEKYAMLRNKVIAKYLENPGKRLAFAECQGLVGSTGELYDLSRIVRFLDTWGIINYLAAGSVHRGLRMATSLLREEPSGELQLLTAPLKSIDGLVLFDRPKCSLQVEDISSMASSSSNSEVVDFDAAFADLDGKIRDRLSESSCSYCLQPFPSVHYRSQKEVCFFVPSFICFLIYVLCTKHVSVSLKCDLHTFPLCAHAKLS
jgi:SWI/SNF related-matrix-associated actin-dependent regulator of chromatin subfamily C